MRKSCLQGNVFTSLDSVTVHAGKVKTADGPDVHSLTAQFASASPVAGALVLV